MSDGQWLFIQAQDVWMFRDSKPFTAQQNFVARSHFPPNPQTMQGVIRTAYLESQNVNWQAYANGSADPTLYEKVGHGGIGGSGKATLGNLSISGPFIGIKSGDTVEPVFRAPLDLLHNSTSGAFAVLSPEKSETFYTNRSFDSWQPLGRSSNKEELQEAKNEERFREVNGWLSSQQFTEYLNGKSVSGSLLKDSDIFEYEDRIGLGLNYDRRAAQKGLLYRATFIRPCDDIGLLVRINQTLFEQPGTIRIGGETRSGKFEIKNDIAFPRVQASSRVKIVLLTPAYFTDGWQPHDQNWSKWVGSGGKLVSAVLGKPMGISGWDIANKRSKPLRHYVPAGSVYYFENAAVTDEPFTESPANEDDGLFGAMGFGTVAIGVWQFLADKQSGE